MNTVEVLKQVTESAQRFVNKAPKQARLQVERQALLDAITRAQLVLSVSPEKLQRQQHDSSTEEDRTEAAALLRSLPGPQALSIRQQEILQGKSRPRRKHGSNR